MTNEQKAKEIAEYLNKPNGSNCLVPCHQAAMAMAKWKDSLPISELSGWSTDEPTDEGFYLVETDDFPKDSRYVVARWYSDNRKFYDEAFEDAITYIRWKKI